MKVSQELSLWLRKDTRNPNNPATKHQHILKS